MANQIIEDFGNVIFVEPENVVDEFGFITPIMEEGKYEEIVKSYDNILHMIRIEE